MNMPSALRHHNFRLFYEAQFISLVGSWMQTAAQGWLVYSLTGSATKLGIVTLMQSLPGLLVTAWGGVIADRYDKRILILLAQVFAMMLAFLLYWLVYSGLVRYEHIVVVALLLGLVNSVEIPARQAFLIDLVSVEDLSSAIALNSSVFNASRIVGPAVAGLVVARWGTANCFLVNGLSFLAPVYILVRMRLPSASLSARRGKSVLAEMMEGLRYIREERRVAQLVALLGITSVVSWGGGVLMPVFARDILHAGPRGYGFLMASSGLGALAGALLLSMSEASSEAVMRARVLGGLGVFCLSLLVFAWSRMLWLSVLCQVVSGWAGIVYFATSNSWVQGLLPYHLRGRVMGVYHTMFQGFMPMGAFIMGGLAEHFGAPLATTASALGTACVLMVAVWGKIGGGRQVTSVAR